MIRHAPGLLAFVAVFATAACAVKAQSTTEPSDSQPVSRKEYEELKKDNEQMHSEMEQMKSEMEKSKTQAAADAADAQQEVDDEIKVLKDAIDKDRSGFDNFTIVGDGNVTFTSQRKIASTFGAELSPLVLWQLNDHLLVEAAADFGINSAPDGSGDPTSGTSVDLTQANITYIVNDQLMVGGGEFVVPFGQYHNHFDPPWIDKLPDDPLAFDAIVPDSEVGVFGRGAVAIDDTKVTYDVYAVNGPQLVINNDPSSSTPTIPGTISYNDFTDQNNNKAVGGRIGWLPVPNIEMGSSIQVGKANPNGFPGGTVRTVLYGVDLNAREDVPGLYGAFDYKTEWVWSNVERATYDVTDAAGDVTPISFSNYSDGGYVQLSYRPTYAAAPLKDFELVGRWDQLNQPITPGGAHEQRYTVGLDYWLTPSVVLKGAYEYVRDSMSPHENVFLLQLGFGL